MLVPDVFKALRSKQQRSKTTGSGTLPNGTARTSPTVPIARLPATVRRALWAATKVLAVAPQLKTQDNDKGSPPKTRHRALSSPISPKTYALLPLRGTVEPATKKRRTVARHHGRSAPCARAKPAHSRCPEVQSIIATAAGAEGRAALQGSIVHKQSTPSESSKAQQGSIQQGRTAGATFTKKPQGFTPVPVRTQAEGCRAPARPPRSKAQKRSQGAKLQCGVPASRPQGGVPASKAAVAHEAAAARCDKCDGVHATIACPHFRKSRDAHPDAQKGAGGGLGGLGGGVPLRLRRGRVAGQPGDGSCLFHSLRFGLQKGGAACARSGGGVPSTWALRRELAEWVASHAQRKIAETPLAMWVKWDSGQSAQTYAARMARGGWGGGIEMAACAHLWRINVWVYEVKSAGFERISCFDAPGRTAGTHTVHVLYRGGVHYDAYVPEPVELEVALAANAAKQRANPQPKHADRQQTQQQTHDRKRMRGGGRKAIRRSW